VLFWWISFCLLSAGAAAFASCSGQCKLIAVYCVDGRRSILIASCIRFPDIMSEQKRVHENALRSVAMEHIKYQAT
jgi:hypothetical protein